MGGTAFLGNASPITYDVDHTVGLGSVSGFIETNGTIGVLNGGEVLDWNLLLNDGSSTFDLTGPLSGSNSVLGLTGSDFSATATGLLFDFSGSDNGHVLFQSPALFTGSDFWCLASSNRGCSSEPIGETVNVLPHANQFTGASGTMTVASTPEPFMLAPLGLGIIALLGFRRQGSKHQRGS
jgi:hypothetical protein